MNAAKLVRNFQARGYSSKPAPSFATMNELPTPKGDWRMHYEATNRRYNTNLFVGITAFVGTVVIGRAMGWLNLHMDYPDKPADIKNYKQLSS